MGSHRDTDVIIYHNYLIGMCLSRWTWYCVMRLDSTFNLDWCARVFWRLLQTSQDMGCGHFHSKDSKGSPGEARCMHFVEMFKKHFRYFEWGMAANIPSSMRFSVPTIQEGSFLFLDHDFVFCTANVWGLSLGISIRRYCQSNEHAKW